MVLEAAGDKKIQVIKEVRSLTSLGLKEAKDLVDGAPKPVLEKVNKESADKAKAALEGAGATVTVNSSNRAAGGPDCRARPPRRAARVRSCQGQVPRVRCRRGQPARAAGPGISCQAPRYASRHRIALNQIPYPTPPDFTPPSRCGISHLPASAGSGPLDLTFRRRRAMLRTA